MSIVAKRTLSLDAICRETHLSPDARERVARDRTDVGNIIAGDDDRMLVIVGPCSAWPASAVRTFADRLAPLAERFADRLKIVMRVYTQKPRTRTGWTGPIIQPDPFADPDIESGVRYVRSLMKDVVERGLPVADELLFTHKAAWIQEYVSWIAIGARSAEDQEHRNVASGLEVATGMKNPTSGALSVGADSVAAAQAPHTFFFDGAQVSTDGNPFAHLILRGGSGTSFANDGASNGPNYDRDHIVEAGTLLSGRAIQNSALIIDASHDNARINGTKDHRQQPAVVRDVLASRAAHSEAARLVKGVMLESFLKEGKQTIDPEHKEALDMEGCSITDPCLGWDATESLIAEMYAAVGE